MKYHVICYKGYDFVTELPIECNAYTSNALVANTFLQQLTQGKGLFQLNGAGTSNIIYVPNVDHDKVTLLTHSDMNGCKLKWFRSKSESDVSLLTTNRLMDRFSECEYFYIYDRYYTRKLERAVSFLRTTFCAQFISSRNELNHVMLHITNLIKLLGQYGVLGLENTSLRHLVNNMDMVSTFVHFRDYIDVRFY